MALDQLQEIVSLHNITTSETTANFIGMPAGAAVPSLKVRVQYFSALLASGSGALTFTVNASYDKGATWATLATGASLALSTSAQTGEQVLVITPRSWPPVDSGTVWVQVLGTFSGSPTGPSVAYRADLV